MTGFEGRQNSEGRHATLRDKFPPFEGWPPSFQPRIVRTRKAAVDSWQTFQLVQALQAFQTTQSVRDDNTTLQNARNNEMFTISLTFATTSFFSQRAADLRGWFKAATIVTAQLPNPTSFAASPSRRGRFVCQESRREVRCMNLRR